jgi:arylsulfatase A-like enzyme
MLAHRARFTLAALSLATGLPALEGHVPPRPAADRPNIIIVLIDDLAYHDIGHIGQRQFPTPHIDRLAEEGRVFTQAYAGGAWCAPSRTGLITGRCDRFFAPVPDPAGGGLRFNPTIAEMLRPVGYATAAIGKWHMLEPDDSADRQPPLPAQMPWNRGFEFCRIGPLRSWNCYFPHELLIGDDQSIPIPENRTVDEAWFKEDYGVAQHFTVSHDGRGIYDSSGRFVDRSGTDITQLRHSEDLYRREAVAFITANTARPFLLYYASPLVHFPVVARDLSPFAGKPAAWTARHKAYAAMVQDVDASVGLIRDTVEALHLERNTIILFAADNGYTAGFNFPRSGEEWGSQLAMWDEVDLFRNRGPWNRGKHMNTIGGLIVPFIAWGPGRVAVGRTDRAIRFQDVMPTVRELAGATAPGPLEGIGFLPLLEGRDADQALHPPMHWGGQALRHATMDDDWREGAVRQTRPLPNGQFRPDAALLDERWFAMSFRGPEETTIRLFDARTDPAQELDVAAQHPDLVIRARAELDTPPRR